MLTSDWYAYYIIGSILSGAIKQNPVTHLRSTNEILRHKAFVYYRWLTAVLSMDNSKFLLHAADLIQVVTYIHPLQINIKTLRAQTGSKTITRVPPNEIASASLS